VVVVYVDTTGVGIGGSGFVAYYVLA